MGEQPSDLAIKNYIRSVGKTPTNDEGQEWRIAHTKVDKKTGIETTPIKGDDLDRLEASIMNDNQIATYEEFSVLREALEERQRLRQAAEGSKPEQVQATEYRINQIHLHRRLILENKETLLKSQKLTQDMQTVGLEFKVNPDIATNAFMHLETLTATVQERVALGQFYMLLIKMSDGKEVPQSLIDEARENLPTVVKAKKTGKKEEIVIDKVGLARMSPTKAMEALVEPIRVAEENVGWLLSYDKDVAGVAADVEGINPVDVYFSEMLAEAVGIATRKEFELALKPNSEAETTSIREFRKQLVDAFKNDIQRIQLRAIENLKDVSLGFADTSYAPDKEKPSYIFPAAMTEKIPEIREESGQQVQNVIGGFRQRTRLVMGGTDEKGTKVKGIMEQSIFDVKDWQLHQEDFYKKHVRFKLVYPVLDGLTRTMAAPDVMTRSFITRPISKAIVGETVTDAALPPLTFKEEAERAMVHVRKAWKLPENIEIDGKQVPFDFYNPDHWDKISPEQWKEIEKSQKSTLDVLTLNKDKTMNALNAIEGDLRNFEALYAIRNPDEMVGVLPDQKTFEELQAGTVSLRDLTDDPEKLKQDPAKLAACYYYMFTDLQIHSDQYADIATDTNAELNEIGDYAIDAGRGIAEGGRNVRIPYWFFTMAGGLLAWYGSAAFRSKSLVFRAAMRMGRDVYSAGKLGVRAAGSTIRGGTNVVRGGARMASDAAETVRGTRTAEELTKLRYIQKERQLAQWLEKTRAGRMVQNLKFIQNSRVASRAGTAFKYGSYAIIPAVGAYEAYLTHQRVKSAEGNAELQAQYSDGYETAALETLGYGAAALLSFGPQVVLTAPVYYAGSYNRDRSEVKAGWAREAADWNREFDSTGLMGQLRTTTLSHAVEAGGGGALYPRIALPSTADQEKAAETIENAQRVARSRIVEAYFTKNLLIPPGINDDVVKKIVQWKTSYVGLATGGSYNLTNASVYAEADLYAELMLRCEDMKAKKEDMKIPFTDDEGRDGILDFSKLAVGTGSRSDIMNQVAQYRNFVRPVEELVLFNALGQMAKDQSKIADKEREKLRATENVRRMMMMKLSHTIFKFDSIIESIDWPGVDSIVSSGDTYSKNVVRTYLAAKISKEIDVLIPKVLEGESSLKNYEKVLRTCQGFMQDAQSYEGAANEVYAKAANSFSASELAAAGSATVNPLFELIAGKLQSE